LRLRQIHNGVFLRFNKATLNMLRSVNTYVTYGTPNVKAVRELVYKRGFANVNKQRIAITDNSVIEKQLGKVPHASCSAANCRNFIMLFTGQRRHLH
jgi:60S ribosomal protein uL30